MKFKIDENLPVEISEMLNNAGYDSKTVNDQKLQGSKDFVIIEINKIKVSDLFIFIYSFTPDCV